jgi:hypothetical protein
MTQKCPVGKGLKYKIKLKVIQMLYQMYYRNIINTITINTIWLILYRLLPVDQKNVLIF